MWNKDIGKTELGIHDPHCHLVEFAAAIASEQAD
jgi:hypothetical protein